LTQGTQISEIVTITEMVIESTESRLRIANSNGNTVEAATLKAEISKHKEKIAEKKSEKKDVLKKLKAKHSEIKRPKKLAIHDVTQKVISKSKKLLGHEQKKKDLRLQITKKQQLLDKSKSEGNESMVTQYETQIATINGKADTIEEYITVIHEEIITIETEIQMTPVKSASRTVEKEVSAAVIAKKQGLALVKQANQAKSDA